MRLAGVTILRDECDIVEAFVRHNAAILDRLYILDNRSSDATPEILGRLAAAGLPISLGRDKEVPYYQGRKTTALIAAALADQAWDCLFPLDADEFLRVADRNTLEAELARLATGEVGILVSDQYAPAESDDAAEADPVARIVHRAAAVPAQPPFLGKAILPAALAPAAAMDEGNHHVLIGGRVAAERRLVSARIAHFPVRSAEQLVAKIATTRLAWLSRGDYRPGLGAHVALLYDRLRDRPQPTECDLQDAAFAYLDSYLGPQHLPYRRRLVRDPLPRRGGPLLHRELANVSALPRVLAFAEAMARCLAEGKGDPGALP